MNYFHILSYFNHKCLCLNKRYTAQQYTFLISYWNLFLHITLDFMMLSLSFKWTVFFIYQERIQSELIYMDFTASCLTPLLLLSFCQDLWRGKHATCSCSTDFRVSTSESGTEASKAPSASLISRKDWDACDPWTLVLFELDRIDASDWPDEIMYALIIRLECIQCWKALTF